MIAERRIPFDIPAPQAFQPHELQRRRGNAVSQFRALREGRVCRSGPLYRSRLFQFSPCGEDEIGQFINGHCCFHSAMSIDAASAERFITLEDGRA